MKTWRAFEAAAQADDSTNIDVHCGGRKGNSMKRYMQAVVVVAALLIGSSLAAFAGDVRTDYDHSVNFSQYNTYSWGKVQTSNPFFVTRIQQAVDKQLQAKGWTLMPTGGSVTVFATDNVHDQQQVQTMYDNMGFGWGGGWGWGGWGWVDGSRWIGGHTSGVKPSDFGRIGVAGVLPGFASPSLLTGGRRFSDLPSPASLRVDFFRAGVRKTDVERPEAGSSSIR